MKNKKLLLVGLAAMGLVAAGTAGVGTAAWYQVSSNAGIVKGTSEGGSLTTVQSTLDVVNYTVNFTITVADSELELSHVVTEAEAAAGLGGIPAANLDTGDLVYGGIYNGNVKLKKATATTNLVTTYSVAASWASEPADAAEIEYLTGKKFTATLTASGQAKFVANAYSGLSNSDTATVQFTIGYSAGVWSFTPGTYTPAGIHVEPANPTSTESGTTGSVAVTAVSSLS